MIKHFKSAHWLFFLAFPIMVLSYSNTLYSPLVLDDFHTFANNPNLHVDHLSKDAFAKFANSYFGITRFIPMMTFGIDYWSGGGSIVAFHMANITIHITTCFILFLTISVFHRSLEEHKVNPLDKKFYSSMLAGSVACLWGVHPIQTSTVTYLVQRMASLQTLFYLACVAAFVWARLSWMKGRTKRARIFAGACATFLASAFLSKENSAMLPVMLLVVEIWFFRPNLPETLWEKWLRSLRTLKGAVFSVVGAGFMGIVIVATIRHFAAGYSGRHFTMMERLLTEARIVMHYMYAILVPNPRVLSIEHDVEVSTSLLSPPTTLLSLMAIGGLLWFSVAYRKKLPLLTFGLVWFFLNLVIESTIVPLELIFDHRMYLPSVGLILAVVEAVRLAGGRLLVSYSPQQRSKLAWSGLAIVCSVLSLMTFYRNEDWRDIITINRDAVEKAPKNPRAHANYSVALSRVGRYEEALAEAYKAIELGRQGLEEHVVATTTVVTVYMQQDLWDKAIEEGERLLAQKPEKFDAMSLPILYLKLAECHRKIGNYSAAYDYVARTVELTQRFPQLSADKRWVYVVLDSLMRDLEMNPTDLDGDGLPEPGWGHPQEWIARRLYELGDHEGALRYARMIPESPESQEVARRIALFRDRTGRQSEHWSFSQKYLRGPWGITEVSLGMAYAIRKHDALHWMRPLGETLLRVAERRNPANPDVHLLKGWYAFEAEKTDDAVSMARRAIDLAPQYAKAWIALGFFEQRAGNLENSLAAFQHTLELYPGYPKRQVLEQLMAQLQTQLVAHSSKEAPVHHAGLMGSFDAHQ